MSDISSDWPSYTDDTGDGRSGTREDSAFFDAMKTAVNNQTLSATNPTLTPADVIDEVVAARGSALDLATRLGVMMNADGTPKTSGFAGYATVTQLLGGLGGVNLIVNDDDQVWCAGDTAAPTGETAAGTGVAVARCGTGLADTTRKIGDFCPLLTRGTTDASLTRTVITGAAFSRAGFLPGLYAAGGAYVKCSTANAARVAIYDGVGYAYSDYHTGGGDWEWLPVTRQINVAATQLQLIRQVNNAAVGAYFSGRTLVLLDSDLDLTRHIPSSSEIYAAAHFSVGGTISTGVRVGCFEPARMGLVRDFQLHIKTAPTGQALIVDGNTWDGAAQTSMFSSKPQIAAAATEGSAQPDDTYARRCFTGQFGTTLAVGGRITIDIDQVGSVVAGVDLGVEVRALQYKDPLEKFQSYTG